MTQAKNELASPTSHLSPEANQVSQGRQSIYLLSTGAHTDRQVMSHTLPSTLTKEVAKLARLSNLQNALPGSMRSLPVAAIVAGGVLAKVTGTSNTVEERMLGVEEMITLDKPGHEQRHENDQGAHRHKGQGQYT
ncbi:uncharacterized protein BJX67DRAFT_167868 [Aspergillus lucknowensis]|uniref:Uncharacterized protein n=1 Tax=Aspergillus lucknowensis TaxID=176173 RepID=A0ABR4M565_9EURO